MTAPLDLILNAASQLGSGPLTQASLVEHIHPLFSRVLSRNDRNDEIYLANHSLGRPLDAVADQVHLALDAWYTDIDGAWGLWIDMRDAYRNEIASILGCSQWDCVVPKTSAGQGLNAVLNALPSPCPKVLTTRGEFDSIDFILKAHAHKGRAQVKYVEPNQHGLFDADDIISAITDDTDLVVCSMVCFVTGQVIAGLDRIINAAHTHNAIILLDAYHAFGTMPMHFDEINADFIIGGNYKYTRGGAGACFLAIHPKHLSPSGGVPAQDALFTTDTGWFAKQDTFKYRRTQLPEFAQGGDAWLESTPPVLTYAQALPGLVLTRALGIDRLRTYSQSQQSMLIELLKAQGIDTWNIDELGFQHGAYILLRVNDGPTTINKLHYAGVNADARPISKSSSPNTDPSWVVRLCPDILNTRDELATAAKRIASVIHTG